MGLIERLNERAQPDLSKKYFAIEQQLEQVKRELERAQQERHGLAEKLHQMRVFVDEISARLVTVESLDQCDQARLLQLFPLLAGGRINAPRLAEGLGISQTMAEDSLTRLVDRNYLALVYCSDARPNEYCLDRRGREFFVKIGLL